VLMKPPLLIFLTLNHRMISLITF